MKIGLPLFLLLFCCAIPFAGGQGMPKYADTFDYIEKTGRLWGIEELVLNANGTVTLVDAKKSGYGHGLIMFDSSKNPVDRVVLSVNQSCSLSDGDHAFIKYELKDVTTGLITVIVTDRFDARSFGHGVREEKKSIHIKPYKRDSEAP